MYRKALPVIAIAVVSVFALSCCAMFNAPKEPVKAHLKAWSQGDVEEAYSYFAPELQASISMEVLADQIERNPVKSFKLTSVNIDGGKGTAVVEGTVTLRDGTRMGLRYELVEKGEDWEIWGYKIHPDLLFEE